MIEGAIERGRELLRRREWTAAFNELSAADSRAPLGAQDLLSLSIAARLLGRETENTALLARAHQAFQVEGDPKSAVRCAFWLGFYAMLQGDSAQANGWLSRARRLLDECQKQAAGDCVEEGYLLIPVGFHSAYSGQPEIAYTAFTEAVAIGERYNDKDLIALARHGQGRALIRKGEIARGVALLDEVMVGVTANEISVNVAGGVYCSVIEACDEIFDFRRAQEWTTALDDWCSSHPEIVAFRGHCQIQRAQVLQIRGRWADAIDAAQIVSKESTTSRPSPMARFAFYRVAEIHRLRGNYAEAESAYRTASQLGKTQQPGWCLLLVAKGEANAAVSMVRNLLQTTHDRSARSIVLETAVEVFLAAGKITEARTLADELSALAELVDAPLLTAIADRWNGAVLIAEGQPSKAQEVLRRSLRFWRDIDAPYEAARVRVLLGDACRAQGDTVSAELERDAACAIFQTLGAQGELARIEVNSKAAVDSPLTAREIEVLVQVASGKSNRAIAKKLFISEKTVARHLSNIFVKLDLSSRSAATAYAYQHKLV